MKRKSMGPSCGCAYIAITASGHKGGFLYGETKSIVLDKVTKWLDGMSTECRNQIEPLIFPLSYEWATCPGCK